MDSLVKIDLTGQKFGRLTVLKQEETKHKHLRWLCLCDCGNIKAIQGGSLRGGYAKSCGCLIKDASTSFGMRGTPTHNSWAGLIQRCTNSNDKSYKNYGGRGIKVCKRWMQFKNFLTDMGIKPNGLTIERIDNSEGYSLRNCKWATPTEQQRNKRPEKRSSTGLNGVTINKKTQKYRAHIVANYKTYCLGTFSSLSDAIEARKQGEQKYWKNPKGVTAR